MPCSQQYSFKGIFLPAPKVYSKQKRKKEVCNLSVFAQAEDREVCGYFLDQEVLTLCIIICGKASKQTKTTTTKNKTKHIFLAKGGPRSQDLKASGGGGVSPASCWK